MSSAVERRADEGAEQVHGNEAEIRVRPEPLRQQLRGVKRSRKNLRAVFFGGASRSREQAFFVFPQKGQTEAHCDAFRKGGGAIYVISSFHWWGQRAPEVKDANKLVNLVAAFFLPNNFPPQAQG